MSKPKVLITFDSMKDVNCGYFSFGKGLGNALLKENNNRFELAYYVFKNQTYTFGEKVRLVKLSPFDKLIFPGRNEFDVVHLSDQTCRLRPSKVNAKKIMTIHDMNKVHLKFSKPHRINAYLKKLGKLTKQVDKIVAISQFVANDVVHYFPDTKDKISVIYNGADKLIVPEGHVPAFRPQKHFLFTIGLLSVQKGFHLLPALLKNNDFELVIAGIETPHKQTILNEAAKYDCLNRVHITGPVSDNDKAWYYQNCSAFLFPSVAEGFGLPVIEALHFGKPVFLSRFTSLPEVGGDAAYYFDNFEPEHMQETFESGMKDFELRNRAAEMIAQADNFSWERAADQYLKLYGDCLSEK